MVFSNRLKGHGATTYLSANCSYGKMGGEKGSLLQKIALSLVWEFPSWQITSWVASSGMAIDMMVLLMMLLGRVVYVTAATAQRRT